MKHRKFPSLMRQAVGIGLLALGALVVGARPATAQIVSTTAQAAKPVTFAKDVMPIFQEKCQVCHRPGNMGPMSLMSYQDARPWARAIKAKVQARAMPPWFLDKTLGIQKFINDSSLSDQQIDIIARWVDAGAPLGDLKDLPPSKQWPGDNVWRLADHFGRPPDLVVRSPRYTMPAVSQDQFTMLVADSGLTEDRWVQGIETRPTPRSRKVVHHATTYVFQAEDAEALRQLKIMHPNLSDSVEDGTIFFDWDIGKAGDVYPKGTGKLLKAGARIGFDMHIFAIGEEVTDVIENGFWLYPKGVVPRHRVYFQTLGSGQTGIDGRKVDIDIPPGSVTVHNGYFVLPAAAIIQNFQPHMHLRGKAFAMEAIYPDGRVEMLNYVPNYAFNWHTNYIYAEDAAPLLPKGTIIKVTAWHDNTSANKNNPDPRQWVGYGSRSVDEMFHSNSELVYLTEEEYQQLLAERKSRVTRGTFQ